MIPEEFRITFYISFFIFNFIFCCVFIILLVYYSKKYKESNTIIYSQIHLLIFSIIYALCNLSAIAYIRKDDPNSFKLPCQIQSFFRLFSMIGIPSSELGILIFTFISFKFSTFTCNHPKLLKIIISLVIWIPVLITFLPELITLIIKNNTSFGFATGGMCLANRYKLIILLILLLLIVLYISFLISLHYSIRKIFKVIESKDSYLQYRNKLIVFYVSLFFTFPQIIINIVSWVYGWMTPGNDITFFLFVLSFISYNLFILISSLIYSFSQKIFQNFIEKLCCKKNIDISDEEKIIQISPLNLSEIN